MTARRPLPDRAALQIDASVTRGEFRLSVTFEVAPGEVVGVLGPNGAGKTTLLRALAGLTAVTTGRIQLGDTVLDDVEQGVFVPPERRPVGLVFQDYRLFPHLSVLDNVGFSARSRGDGRAGSRRHAARWLDRLDLATLAERRPTEISGGQAQRVALARALAAGPELLLLDEPLSALDAQTRLDVRTRLRLHLTDFPGPVLLVTHDPLEAMVLADRLLVVEDGAVVQEGTPAEVARHPATQYVARLVGINLYAGTLDVDGTTVRLDVGGTLQVTAADEIRPPGRVLVGLRPSAVTLHTSRPEHASPRNVWTGTVGSFERLADRVRVDVAATPPALVDLTPAAVAELGLHGGQQVWLSAKATETDAYADSGGP